MKAAVLYEGTKIETREVEDLFCESKDVKIRVKSCGICGSDIHKMQTTWKYKYPATMGHEFVGEIVEIGRDVAKYKVGDRVVCIPFLPCRSCNYCEQGHYSMCENYKMIGTHLSGGFAEYSVIPESNILSIKDLDYDKASFIEPLAVVMHAIMGIKVEIGDSVIIFGAGTIGMLSLQVVNNIGTRKIIVVDIDNEKLKLAKEYGATHTINSLEENLQQKVNEYTNNLGADIALECAGSPITQEQALLVTKKRGKIAYTGIAYKDVTLKEEAFENIFRKELTLKGFWNSYSAPFPGREWLNAIDFLITGKVKVDSLISHTFSVDEVNKAFEMILNKKEKYNKVLIKP
ncbi:galactitol-1-phosphate 5-dehydrogenase [Gemella sp. GH3]|uniref:galactitol-1-phosphate 5-dehydrogenase n=1 Tax=unclassified Gemella TaxID=2624949 RepID=UPI0015CFE39C|nr:MULTISPECIES: galactitol-1-phosphate 5-dehydrogenase [unclassified Gemella]MBF0714020.1 galactitol-1-phosphate 5-dehydrogenase [Gemella sp. GH3.1]NYS50972.1 galactitol-1-phosphate 5-dehydrogenase [Gemella sp. GH3]